MILVIDNYDSFTWNLVQYLQELAAARGSGGETRGGVRDETDDIVNEPAEILVRRNDEVSLAEALAMRPAGIVISPGPCTPDEAGISLELVRAVAGVAGLEGVSTPPDAIEGQVAKNSRLRASPADSAKGAPSGASAPPIPLLGVCLGHQCIAQALGGRIVQAREIVHGKASTIHHRGGGVLAGLARPFEATRYHSLVVDETSLPVCLEVTAWTELADPPGHPAERPERLIMGLAHRELPIHGVQFHPESILTTEGKALMANFLEMACGPVDRVSVANE